MRHRATRRSAMSLSWALLALAAAPCHATSVYQLVDVQGQVHLSGAVPVPYRTSASAIDYEPFDLTVVQKQETLKKQQQEASLMLAAASAAERASAAARIDSPASTPAAAKPLTCAQKIAAYRQSEACFAPYKLANGGTKAEAFKHCKLMLQPNCS